MKQLKTKSVGTYYHAGRHFLYGPHNGRKAISLWSLLSLLLVAIMLLLGMSPVSANKAASMNAPDFEIVSDLIIDPGSPVSGQMVRASFSIRNTGATAVHLEQLGVGGRGPGCADWACEKYQDFPFHAGVTIQPGGTHPYSEEHIFFEDGSYFVQVAYELTPGAWYILGERLDFDVASGLQISEELQLTPAEPASNELVFATFTLTNSGDFPQSYEKVGIAARGPDCPQIDWGCSKNVDFLYSESVTLNRGQSHPFTAWRPFSEPGSYFAQIAVQDIMGNWHQLGSPTTFSVHEATMVPRISTWQFGVHFHPQWTEEDRARLRLARSAGAEVMRIGASWKHLEPDAKGNWAYDWYIPALEKRIVEANALGIDVYLLLLQVPCWASSDPAKNCETQKWDDAYPPTNYDDYTDAYRKLIELYGNRVNVWEVWNEPNVDRFWQPAPDAAAYTQLLQKSYLAIKAQDSSAVVLGGSLAGADTIFLNSMYEAGAKGYFDALALHPYSGGAPDDCSFGQWTYKCGVESIRSMMLHHADPKKIWITEFGWSSADQPPGFGEEKQKEYLQEALKMVEYWEYVPVATWYNLVDTDFRIPDLAHEDYMGLFDRTYRAKPTAVWLRDHYFPHKIYLPFTGN